MNPEHLMPCGHGSRFLVVDPIKGCGTGLANHYCGECEMIERLKCEKSVADADYLEVSETAMNALKRVAELESKLAGANETIKWARIVSEHSQIKQEPGA